MTFNNSKRIQLIERAALTLPPVSFGDELATRIPNPRIATRIGKRKIENLLAVAVTFPAKSMRDTIVSGKNHTTKSDTTSGANINAR